MVKDVLKDLGKELYLIFQRMIILLSQEALSSVHFSKVSNLINFSSTQWQVDKGFQTQL